MKSGGGKSKGSAFERLVCVKLSLWLSSGLHEDLLWRSSMSGGRATVAHAKGKRLAAQSGDISAIHELGMPLTNKFLLECKFYRDLEYSGLITGKGKLIQFWNTACIEAERYSKEPMLIAKQNQKPITVCLKPETMQAFGLNAELIAPKQELAIILFDDFIAGAKPCT